VLRRVEQILVDPDDKGGVGIVGGGGDDDARRSSFEVFGGLPRLVYLPVDSATTSIASSSDGRFFALGSASILIRCVPTTISSPTMTASG